MTAFTGQAADRRAATLIPDTSLLALPLDGQVRRADDEDPFDETAEPQLADQRAGQDLSLLDDGLGSHNEFSVGSAIPGWFSLLSQWSGFNMGGAVPDISAPARHCEGDTPARDLG